MCTNVRLSQACCNLTRLPQPRNFHMGSYVCTTSSDFLFADDAKLCKHNCSIFSCPTVTIFLYLELVQSAQLKCVKSQKISTSYQFNSTPLPQLSQHRDLGLLLSYDLSWSKHYQQISVKVYKYFGTFLKISNLYRLESYFTSCLSDPS